LTLFACTSVVLIVKVIYTTNMWLS